MTFFDRFRGPKEQRAEGERSSHTSSKETQLPKVIVNLPEAQQAAAKKTATEIAKVKKHIDQIPTTETTAIVARKNIAGPDEVKIPRKGVWRSLKELFGGKTSLQNELANDEEVKSDLAEIKARSSKQAQRRDQTNQETAAIMDKHYGMTDSGTAGKIMRGSKNKNFSTSEEEWFATGKKMDAQAKKISEMPTETFDDLEENHVPVTKAEKKGARKIARASIKEEDTEAQNEIVYQANDKIIPRPELPQNLRKSIASEADEDRWFAQGHTAVASPEEDEPELEIHMEAEEPTEEERAEVIQARLNKLENIRAKHKSSSSEPVLTEQQVDEKLSKLFSKRGKEKTQEAYMDTEHAENITKLLKKNKLTAEQAIEAAKKNIVDAEWKDSVIREAILTLIESNPTKATKLLKNIESDEVREELTGRITDQETGTKMAA